MFFSFNEEPKCNKCNKIIEGGDETYIKLKYPKRRGQTEIKAFLKNEGIFYCKNCIGVPAPKKYD